ncbi:MAG: SymE family type I addiction module toxin [Firmicutes bacterium]|nr:SymE family type I addiction module toxin [Bacillota bacterium]
MTRMLKVYTAPTHDGRTPQIRLQGQWLKEAGFELGKPIIVEVLGGEIRITLKDEVIVEAENTP